MAEAQKFRQLVADRAAYEDITLEEAARRFTDELRNSGGPPLRVYLVPVDRLDELPLSDDLIAALAGLRPRPLVTVKVRDGLL